MVSIGIERAFAIDGEKIHLLTAEVLLRAAAGKIVKPKKIRDWTSRNAVFFLTFLIEIVIADGETAQKRYRRSSPRGSI